jgi:hypothetical protein
MPRLGYEDPCAYYRALRPPSRTLRFPRNPDGGMSEENGPLLNTSVAMLPTAASMPVHAAPSMPSHALTFPRETDSGRSASGASRGWSGTGDIDLTRLHSVSEPTESRASGPTSVRRFHGARPERTESGGLCRSQRIRKSIENSHCPVIHPRLASNSAIPENLKLLDIVETIAGPAPSHSGHGFGSGSGGASVAVQQEGLNAGGARNDREAASDAGYVGKEEPVMDLADRLEERMRSTGQLVKVKTQAELDVLLPRAPKVFGGESTHVAVRTASTGTAPASAQEPVAGESRALQGDFVVSGSSGGPAEGVSDGSLPLKAAVGHQQISDGAEEESHGAGGMSGEDRAGPGLVAGGSSLAQAKDGTAVLEKVREKWIYVWDMHSRLYINRKLPGRFHHSSFVAGGAVKAAGSIVVEDGVLKQLTTWSGHYRPRSSDIAMFLEWLEAKQVNMKDVELLLVKPHKQSKMNQPVDRR